MATILCKYGYFFHVTANGSSVVVKPDNEMYRFQVGFLSFILNFFSTFLIYFIYGRYTFNRKIISKNNNIEMDIQQEKKKKDPKYNNSPEYNKKYYAKKRTEILSTLKAKCICELCGSSELSENERA